MNKFDDDDDFNLIDFENDDDIFNLNENDFDDICVNKLDICGLVEKMKSKRRIFFEIGKELKQLKYLLNAPPKKDEVFKMLSVGGGFSSISIINYICLFEEIEELYVSTFRIGQKQFEVLNNLYKKGKIKKAHFITSNTQKNVDQRLEYNEKTYNYFDFIEKICKKNNWEIKIFDNHSKLILMKTEKNFYVVETSSNLNQNPKMEQFSFENDKKLFDFYEKLFLELLKN